MDPRMISKGRPSGEYNYGEQDGSRRANEPGVYYHPQADKFVETAGAPRSDGSIAYAQHTGKVQADAFVQIGYRHATKEEATAYEARKKDQEKANRIEASRKTTVL
jgi:hypothetical protein